jgi:hypothetical protein
VADLEQSRLGGVSDNETTNKDVIGLRDVADVCLK